MRIVDLTGQTFGQWTALEIVGRTKSGQCIWRCRCTCGNERVIQAGNLRRGKSKKCWPCATLQLKELAKLRPTLTHGLSTRTEYRILSAARQRCRNPRNSGYPYYGGRGIEYRLPPDAGEATRLLIEHLGPRPNGMTLDRIDVNGHYELGNLRWATWSQQMKNRRAPNGLAAA